MDAPAATPAADPEPADVLPFPVQPPPADAGKRTEVTLDALKRAIAEGGEHRLFRAGKLPGLFPTRTGIAAEAALRALADGLLETVRTETKGKAVVEWVRVTPKGVGYVHDRDSPAAVLRELRNLLGDTRDGVPAWMDDARREVAAASERFEKRAADLLARLDALAGRVEGALRRAEAVGLRVPDPVTRVVPWGVEALEYLDRRQAAGAAGPCPLAELFDAVRGRHPGLGVPAFHAGLRRLHDVRAVRLVPGTDAADPEFGLIVEAETCYFAER